MLTRAIVDKDSRLALKINVVQAALGAKVRPRGWLSTQTCPTGQASHSTNMRNIYVEDEYSMKLSHLYLIIADTNESLV